MSATCDRGCKHRSLSGFPSVCLFVGPGDRATPPAHLLGKLRRTSDFDLTGIPQDPALEVEILERPARQCHDQPLRVVPIWRSLELEDAGAPCIAGLLGCHAQLGVRQASRPLAHELEHVLLEPQLEFALNTCPLLGILAEVGLLVLGAAPQIDAEAGVVQLLELLQRPMPLFGSALPGGTPHIRNQAI